MSSYPLDSPFDILSRDGFFQSRERSNNMVESPGPPKGTPESTNIQSAKPIGWKDNSKTTISETPPPTGISRTKDEFDPSERLKIIKPTLDLVDPLLDALLYDTEMMGKLSKSVHDNGLKVTIDNVDMH